MATSIGSTYEEIEKSVLHLPLPDRSRLVARLLASLEEEREAEITPAWKEELRRRVEDIDKGRTELISGEEVWERVNRRFGTHFNG